MTELLESGIENLSKMNFEVSEEQQFILEQVDRACKELRPYEDTCYLERRFNEKVPEIFRKAQLLGLPISKKYGEGQGADTLTYMLALQRIGREGTGVRGFFSGHTSLGQLTVQKWATEDQKQGYLTKTTRGEMIMAFGLTEPGAGSDPAALKTSFEDKGSYFLLNGTKAWITNGSIADAIVIFAYPKGKSEGMCAFIVEKTFEGFNSQPQKHTLGLVTGDVGMIFLDNCKVPKKNMLGPVGKGLSVAYSGLMSGRLSVAAGSIGVLEDCIMESVSFSKARVQHKKPIAKHQLVQRHLGIMLTNFEAARLLTYEAAVAKQRSEENLSNVELRDRADTLIAQAKYFASNASFDAADRAVQIMGSSGYSFENRPARHLCDTRVCRIYEGTDEIMEQKIAVSVLGREYEAYS